MDEALEIAFPRGSIWLLRTALDTKTAAVNEFLYNICFLFFIYFRTAKEAMFIDLCV